MLEKYHYITFFKYLKNILADGEVDDDEIDSLKGGYVESVGAKNIQDKNWKDKGHGVLTDLGSHIIDLMMFLFPKDKFEFDAIEKNIITLDDLNRSVFYLIISRIN